MQQEALSDVEVKAFCQKKVAVDQTLKSDTQFSLIAGGLDYDGSFRQFNLWTYYDHHTMLRPGFLDGIVGDNPQSYLGARIQCECRNLSDDPRDWTFCDVVILEVKSRQGGGERTVLGLLGGPPRKATPVDDREHDKPNGANGQSDTKSRRKLK